MSAATGKQVRMRLVYVDFWSAMKLSFLAAVVLAIFTMLAFYLIFLIVQGTGLLAYADELFDDMTVGAFDLAKVVALPQVMAFAAVTSILNLVVVTTLGAVTAAIFNQAVHVEGGPEVGFVAN